MNATAFIRPTWLVLLLLSFFFAWWVFGQSSPELVPVVAIVAPFANDAVQDSIVVIAKPANPESISKAVVRLEQEGNTIPVETKELSPSNNWMTELDSTQLPNGSSNVVVESCSGNNCFTQTIPVQVQNPALPESPAETPSVPPTGGTPPSITPFIQLTPSNIAGAFYLFKLDSTEPFLTSSGDSLSIEPGTFAVKFVPLDFPLQEISSNELHATQNATVLLFEKNVFQKTFLFEGKEFEPIQSIQISWGLQALNSKAVVQSLPETKLFFCLDWLAAEKQCNSSWQSVASDSNPPAISFSVQSIVIAWAKPKPLPPPPTEPPVVTPRVPPPSIEPIEPPIIVPREPLFSVAPSNVPAQAELFDEKGNLVVSSNQPFEIKKGAYRGEIVFSNQPVLGISLEEVRVDQNGTLAQLDLLNALLVSAPDSALEWKTIFSLSSDFAFSKGLARIILAEGEQLFKCLPSAVAAVEVDAVCSNWEPVSVAELVAGKNIFGIAKKRTLPPKTITIVPSNIPAALNLFDAAGNLFLSTKEAVEIPSGTYSAELEFAGQNFSKIVLTHATLDSNVTLVEIFPSLPASISAPSAKEDWVWFSVFKPNIVFEKGELHWSPFSSSLSLFQCAQWSLEKNACETDWRKAFDSNPATLVHSFFPSVQAFGFARAVSDDQLAYLLELLRKGKYSGRLFVERFEEKKSENAETIASSIVLDLGFVEDKGKSVRDSIAEQQPLVDSLPSDAVRKNARGKIVFKNLDSVFSLLELQSAHFQEPTPQNQNRSKPKPFPVNILESIATIVQTILGIKESAAEEAVDRNYAGKLPRGAEIKTDIVAIQSKESGSVEILLPKKGHVNAILKCKEWDFNRFVCNGTWERLETKAPVAVVPVPLPGEPIEDQNKAFFAGPDFLHLQPRDPPDTSLETVSFSTNDLNAAYAGASITIINIQSYPEVGGIWEVRFTTEGKADLRVRAINGTTWSDSDELHDLRFLEIACGDKKLPFEWIEDANLGPYAVVQNYECPETGFERSKVLTHGKHALEFRFGNDVGFAYNQTITEVKTVEFFVGQRENSTDLGENTYETFPDFNAYLPESGISVKSAWIELYALSTFIDTTGTVEVTKVDFNVNNTIYSPVTGQYTSEAAEPEPFLVRANITNQFDSFSNPKLFTVAVKVDSGSTNHRTNAHALKMYVTYQYSPDSATQIKTVKFPLGAKTGEIAAGTDTNFAYNAIVPENSVSIRSRWFEMRGSYGDASTSDFQLQASVNSETLSTGTFWDNAWRDSADVLYLFSPASGSAFALNTDQNLRILNTNQTIQHAGGELVVTYEYANSSPTHTKTVSYFMGQDTNRDNITVNTFEKAIFFPENNVTIDHVWAIVGGSFDSVTASTHTIGGKIGSTPLTSQAFTVDAGSEMISGYRFVYDMSSAKSSLSDGTVVDVNSVYGGATSSAAGAILRVTYRSNADSPKKQNTVGFFAGNSANGTVGSHTFTDINTFVTSGTVNTRRSAFLDFSAIYRGSAASLTVTTDINSVSSLIVQLATSGEPAYYWIFNGDDSNKVEATDNDYTVVCTFDTLGACTVALFLTYEAARGSLSFVINNPSVDNATYTGGVNFAVDGRTTCNDQNCGAVDTNLQYCVGAGCTGFYDINSEAGSPLGLVTGTIPDSNSDLNVNQSYDVNWTIVGNTTGTYELRFRGKGTQTDANTTNGTDRTITITSASASSPDVNVLNPNSRIMIGVNDGNASIDFNVSDADSNYLNADLYYSATAGSFSNLIVQDLNLYRYLLSPNADINCTNTNGKGFLQTQTCHYDWNVLNLPTQKVFLDINVADNGDLNKTDSSDTKFKLHNWLTATTTQAVGYNNKHSLARTTDSNLWLVYHDVIDGNGQVFITRSDNNGSTWKTPIALLDRNVPTQTAANVYNPAIDANSSNGLHVVWSDGNGSQDDIHYRNCDAGKVDCLNSNNWSADINISADNNNSAYSSIAIGSNGTLHVVWATIPSDVAQSRAYYSQCSGMPCTGVTDWSTPVRLKPSTAIGGLGSFYYPSIDVNNTGTIGVVASYAAGLSDNIDYHQCTGSCTSASNWNTGTVVYSETLAAPSYAFFVFDANNTAIAGGIKGSTSTSVFKYCNTNCTAAENWASSSFSPGTSVSPLALAIDSDKNTHFLWDIGAGEYDINYARRQFGTGGTMTTSTERVAGNSVAVYNVNTRRDTNWGTGFQRLEYCWAKGAAADYNIVCQSDFLANPSGGAADYSFVLLLPSTGCTQGKGSIDAGVSCDKGYFEATDLSGLADQNKVDAEGQSSSQPFFVYDNQSTSSSDLNILLDLNQALPGTLFLKVSKIYAGWAGTCTGDTDTNCLQVSTTATNIGKAVYTGGQQDLNIFLWGDFLAAIVGSTDRNVDSNSIAP